MFGVLGSRVSGPALPSVTPAPIPVRTCGGFAVHAVCSGGKNRLPQFSQFACRFEFCLLRLLPAQSPHPSGRCAGLVLIGSQLEFFRSSASARSQFSSALANTERNRLIHNSTVAHQERGAADCGEERQAAVACHGVQPPAFQLSTGSAHKQL